MKNISNLFELMNSNTNFIYPCRTGIEFLKRWHRAFTQKLYEVSLLRNTRLWVISKYKIQWQHLNIFGFFCMCSACIQNASIHRIKIRANQFVLHEKQSCKYISVCHPCMLWGEQTKLKLVSQSVGRLSESFFSILLCQKCIMLVKLTNCISLFMRTSYVDLGLPLP